MAGGFTGRSYAITGAASGIGRALALHLGAQGARLALADRDAAGLETVARSLGEACFTSVFDCRDSAANDRFIAESVERFGSLDGGVPCAGMARSAPVESMSNEAWEAVIGLNLTAVFYFCRAAGRAMLPQGKGALVLIASISAKGGQSGRANYCASKWGIAGLAKTLAVEWGHRGIRTNAVAPNGVDTPMIRDGLPPAFVDGVMLDRTPLGRLARVEEVASAIAFLLGDGAAYINGAVLEVDGGLTAGFMTHQNGADFALRKGAPP